jgi:hypothetical protein
VHAQCPVVKEAEAEEEDEERVRCTHSAGLSRPSVPLSRFSRIISIRCSHELPLTRASSSWCNRAANMPGRVVTSSVV